MADAYERVKIQYGTSYVYPISCMGAHVSSVPNQQVGRTTPLKTRGNVAMFGAFGYEMDLNTLSDSDKEIVKEQVHFFKEHRKLFQYGRFYRLQNPFEQNDAAWMSVDSDKKEAIVGFYRKLGIPNGPWERLYLQGLAEDKEYVINDDETQSYYGSELMNAGLVIHQEDLCDGGGDFCSALYHIKVK